MPDDPLSAVMETHWTEEHQRGDWHTRVETYTRHSATRTHWIIWGQLDAYRRRGESAEPGMERGNPASLTSLAGNLASLTSYTCHASLLARKNP